MKQNIETILANLNDEELVNLWNEYCSETGNDDDHIFSMNEFDEVMECVKPWDIARAAFYGGFCPAHEWFWFNGYGNLESADYISLDTCKPIDFDALCDWIAENDIIPDIFDDDEDEAEAV